LGNCRRDGGGTVPGEAGISSTTPRVLGGATRSASINKYWMPDQVGHDRSVRWLVGVTGFCSLTGDIHQYARFFAPGQTDKSRAQVTKAIIRGALKYICDLPVTVV